jgi:quercetin dioxygenase-like cupin family protein
MSRLVTSSLLIVALGRMQPAGVPDRTTVLDNNVVAVTRLHFAPGAAETPHTHPFPLVIVQVTSGTISLTDGELTRVGSRPGEVWFIPADTRHAARNTASAPVDMLGIALKPDRPPAPEAPPTDAPPGIRRATLVDNTEVRIVRVRFDNGAREPLHTHPNDLLTVQVSPGRVEIVNGSNRSSEQREAGFVQFVARGVPHAYASADAQPFELLSIAIK